MKEFTIYQGGNWIQAPKVKKVLKSSCFVGGAQKISVIMPDRFVEIIEIEEEDINIMTL